VSDGFCYQAYHAPETRLQPRQATASTSLETTSHLRCTAQARLYAPAIPFSLPGSMHQTPSLHTAQPCHPSPCPSHCSDKRTHKNSQAIRLTAAFHHDPIPHLPLLPCSPSHSPSSSWPTARYPLTPAAPFHHDPIHSPSFPHLSPLLSSPHLPLDPYDDTLTPAASLSPSPYTPTTMPILTTLPHILLRLFLLLYSNCDRHD
jgi:hypothetical protein